MPNAKSIATACEMVNTIEYLPETSRPNSFTTMTLVTKDIMSPKILKRKLMPDVDIIFLKSGFIGWA